MANQRLRSAAGFVLSLVGVLCGTAVFRDEPMAAAEAGRTDVSETVFLLTLVDQETGAAIEGADIHVRVAGEGFQAVEKTITSDRRGLCRIPLPENLPDPHFLSVSVRKAHGHVLVVRGWGSYPGREPIPETFTLRLEKSTSIGGVVTDEHGQPIVGVKVEFSVPSDGRGVYYRIPSERTDAQGKWRSDKAPPRIASLSIRLEHPDYASSRSNSYDHSLPGKQLRDFTGILVMKKGLTVRGIVRDDRGNAVENALIRLGSSGFFAREARSDAEGRFRFENCKRQSETLTVQAPGKMPEMRRLDPVEASELEFAMRPGRQVRIRVVDL